MTNQQGFNVVGGKENIEVTASACHRNAMPQLDLSAGEIDSRVDISPQAIRMVKQVQDTHR
jgi:hypothetical protein